MSKVRLDTRMAGFSGIGTYIRGLMEGFQIQGMDTASLVSPLESSNPPIYSLQEQWEILKSFRRSDARLLHAPHYNVPAAMASQCVVTVHDLIHLLFPQFLPSRLAYLYAQFFLRVVIPRTRSILTVSEYTKNDLIKYLKIKESHITVTPLGFDPAFSPQAKTQFADLQRRLRIPDKYFLYVGNLKEFKNTPRLLKVYASLRHKTPGCPALVLAGRNFIDGFEEAIRETPGVLHLSSVDRQDLPALYGGAFALVFPSLYEGFGLPPLESMACGTPVICSNVASIPEVVGDAALFVDPHDQQSIEKAMSRLLNDSELHQTLQKKGIARAARFHWKETAAKTLGVYERCLS